jgi:mRNA-degrading endonuclease RelE of RelBE toxin-antitoxin system
MARRAKSRRNRLVERTAVAELQRGMARRANISKLCEERLGEPRPAEENGKKSQKRWKSASRAENCFRAAETNGEKSQNQLGEPRPAKSVSCAKNGEESQEQQRRMARRAKSVGKWLVERTAVAELQIGISRRAKISKLCEELLEQPRPPEKNGKKNQKG